MCTQAAKSIACCAHWKGTLSQLSQLSQGFNLHLLLFGIEQDLHSSAGLLRNTAVQTSSEAQLQQASTEQAPKTHRNALSFNDHWECTGACTVLRGSLCYSSSL